MKRFILPLLFIIASFGSSAAQKFGYVNTQDILNKLDEYQAAQAEIDQQSKKWQEELEKMYQETEEAYNKYVSEKVLLPEDIRQQREKEIMNLEAKARDFKKEKFGYDGELYKIQDEKIKPIQDRVFEAIEQVAKDRKLDIILDKAGNSGILYTNAAFDRTDDVLLKLGVSK